MSASETRKTGKTQTKDTALLIVTGLSGAGMSSSLKHMEDMGYEVFDNFPPGLVPALMDDAPTGVPVAVGIDSRARGFSAEVIMALLECYDAQLLFLTADESCLQRRFKETRRKHPMAEDRTVADGIERETVLMAPLQQDADVVIDTTTLSVHDLRHLLEGHFADTGKSRLAITLMSFGFKYGAPREADIMMDVRFLKNPHWDPTLRPLSGLDKAVGDYIEQEPGYEAFLSALGGLIKPLLPRYRDEGKTYLTIAIGCTGGRHRSVFTVERLFQLLQEDATPSAGFCLSINHRDIERQSQ